MDVYKEYNVFLAMSRCKVYHVYRGDFVKKTESVTYRTDKPTKEILLQIAAEKKWSISQLSEEIIKEWLQEKRPELLEKE